MKRDKIVYGALLCGVVLLCNSCMLGRRQIKSPELELPATVVAGATDSLTMADMAWWNVYSDSTLTALIERTPKRSTTNMWRRGLSASTRAACTPMR